MTGQLDDAVLAQREALHQREPTPVGRAAEQSDRRAEINQLLHRSTFRRCRYCAL